MTELPTAAAALSPLDPLAISRDIRDSYHNSSLVSVNDHEIRMSIMTEGFAWHHHPNSDESFLVIDGELVLKFHDREVVLKPGQFLTVPRGVSHRTRPAGARSVNLTFEKAGAETIFD
jgi:mannose-6-phosphate isomerase-like protein (cupin superfamily)